MAAKKPLTVQVGSISINGVRGMTQEQRNQVANWLRRVGDGIRNNGKEYADGKFTARFHLPSVSKK